MSLVECDLYTASYIKDTANSCDLRQVICIRTKETFNNLSEMGWLGNSSFLKIEHSIPG